MELAEQAELVKWQAPVEERELVEPQAEWGSFSLRGGASTSTPFNSANAVGEEAAGATTSTTTADGELVL